MKNKNSLNDIHIKFLLLIKSFIMEINDIPILLKKEEQLQEKINQLIFVYAEFNKNLQKFMNFNYKLVNKLSSSKDYDEDETYQKNGEIRILLTLNENLEKMLQNYKLKYEIIFADISMLNQKKFKNLFKLFNNLGKDSLKEINKYKYFF